MTRTGKPRWPGFSRPLCIPLLPEVSSPGWWDIKFWLLEGQRNISIQACPLVIALLQPRRVPAARSQSQVGTAPCTQWDGMGRDGTGWDGTGGLSPARLKCINWAASSP